MDATFHSSLNTSRMFVPETPGVEDKRLSRLIRKGKEYTQNPIAIVLLKHPRKGQRVYTKPYCYSTPSTPSDRAKSTQNPIAIVFLAHPRTGQRVHKPLLLLYSQDTLGKGKEYTKPYCYSTPSTPSDRAKSTQNPIAIVLLAHPRTGQRVHKTLLLLYSKDTLGKGKEYSKPYCYSTPSTPSEDLAGHSTQYFCIVILFLLSDDSVKYVKGTNHIFTLFKRILSGSLKNTDECKKSKFSPQKKKIVYRHNYSF